MPKSRPLISTAFGLVATMVVLVFVGIAINQYFSTDGYTQVWPGGVLEVSGTTVIAGSNCTAMVADTTEERAQAIVDALANSTGPRPDTWTSWKMSLNSFNVTVDAVQIQRFDGKYYYSDVLLHGMTDQEKVLRLDMRPTDAMALAIRVGAPIYINTTLLKEVGKDICGGTALPAAG
jgi:bifunctional DNase/RNase